MPLIKGSNKLLASLPVSDKPDILEISLSKTRLAPGARIFDEEIDRVLFIEKGLVSAMVVTREGDSLGISIIGSEGVVGLTGVSASDYKFQFRALTPVDALQISAQSLTLACSTSGALEALLRNYSQRLLNDAIRTLVCHYHHDLEVRLPRWLLTATERMHSNKLYIKQEILAEAHGVTPAAISLTLEDLESNGLIARARGQIAIINRRRLRLRSCHCSPSRDQEKKYIIKTRSL